MTTRAAPGFELSLELIPEFQEVAVAVVVVVVEVRVEEVDGNRDKLTEEFGVAVGVGT